MALLELNLPGNVSDAQFAWQCEHSNAHNPILDCSPNQGYGRCDVGEVAIIFCKHARLVRGAIVQLQEFLAGIVEVSLAHDTMELRNNIEVEDTSFNMLSCSEVSYINVLGHSL